MTGSGTPHPQVRADPLHHRGQDEESPHHPGRWLLPPPRRGAFTQYLHKTLKLHDRKARFKLRSQFWQRSRCSTLLQMNFTRGRSGSLHSERGNARSGADKNGAIHHGASWMTFILCENRQKKLASLIICSLRKSRPQPEEG